MQAHLISEILDKTKEPYISIVSIVYTNGKFVFKLKCQPNNFILVNFLNSNPKGVTRKFAGTGFIWLNKTIVTNGGVLCGTNPMHPGISVIFNTLEGEKGHGIPIRKEQIKVHRKYLENPSRTPYDIGFIILDDLSIATETSNYINIITENYPFDFGEEEIIVIGYDLVGKDFRLREYAATYSSDTGIFHGINTAETCNNVMFMGLISDQNKKVFCTDDAKGGGIVVSKWSGFVFAIVAAQKKGFQDVIIPLDQHYKFLNRLDESAEASIHDGGDKFGQRNKARPNKRRNTDSSVDSKRSAKSQGSAKSKKSVKSYKSVKSNKKVKSDASFKSDKKAKPDKHEKKKSFLNQLFGMCGSSKK